MAARKEKENVRENNAKLKRSISEVPLKERMYSTWYRFRYGWQFQTSTPQEKTPLWLLGKCYFPEDLKATEEEDKERTPAHVISFMQHFNSLSWMTYRTHFSPISNTPFTSDCGWGCMVRSGQMLLATALHYYTLGREWRLASSDDRDRTVHRHILSWFADSPKKLCPFSLHSLMRQAEIHGYRPGDWYGPSQIATLICRCVERSKVEHPNLQNLIVYLARDCTVYVKDVEQLFSLNENASLFLLVPVRLGGEALNPVYIPCVQNLLSLDHCLGIIGGKPKHSVYFVGFQGDKLIHLDPHYCQVAVDLNSSDFDIRSYHCTTPRKLSASKMDPSCTIGFFCNGRDDFDNLRRETEPVLIPPKQRGVYPFFTFADSSLGDLIDNTALGRVDISTVSGGGGKGEGIPHHRFPDLEESDEDFVLLDHRTQPTQSNTGTGMCEPDPDDMGYECMDLGDGIQRDSMNLDIPIPGILESARMDALKYASMGMDSDVHVPPSDVKYDGLPAEKLVVNGDKAGIGHSGESVSSSGT